ncbi:tail fiber domain-containing protein, partial [Candidatus Kaiserbacteria bacterium]|nr:tail fiber domain-containing protein [Candidatus Kaiserbacteria bacterium]
KNGYIASFIGSTGNVGIGTTSPGAKLEVVGSGVYTVLGDGTNGVYFTGNQLNAAYSTNASANLHLNYSGYQNGTTQFRNTYINDGKNGYIASFIGSTGNVGIGTTSPGAKLAVGGGNFIVDSLNAIGWGSRSVQFVGDTTNNYLRFDTSGAEKVRIDSSGNVGIGDTSPDWPFSVSTNGATASGNWLNVAKITDDDDNKGIGLGYDSSSQTGIVAGFTSSAASNLAFWTYTGSVWGERMRINSTGNVGIGTTGPGAKLQVQISDTAGVSVDEVLRIGATGADASGDGAYINFDFGSTSYAQIAGAVDNANQGSLRFYTRNTTPAVTERMRINTSGNVGIGTTSPWRTLSVTGTVGFDGLTGSTGAGSLCLDSNKQVVYNSASDACLSSTRDTKKDIETLSFGTASTTALDVIAELDPVSFIYKQGDGRTRYGFIAEDTADVDDILATHNEAGAITGIDDRAILSVVVKAVQEMWSQVQAYFVRTETLEERVETLEARIRELESGNATPTSPSGGSSGDNSSSVSNDSAIPTENAEGETIETTGSAPDTASSDTTSEQPVDEATVESSEPTQETAPAEPESPAPSEPATGGAEESASADSSSQTSTP